VLRPASLTPLLLLQACSAPAELDLSTGPALTLGVTIERRLGAMGTWLDLEVTAPDRPTALTWSEVAVRAVAEVEARLSTWSEESELAALNRAPVGQAVRLSPALADDLERARALQATTGGAFDPALGPLVAAWGLRSGGVQPIPEDLARARAASGLDRFAFEAPDRVRRLHPDAAFEEGGFGKGLGLDLALTRLREAGVHAAWIDLGGQVAFLGRGERVARLADPLDRARPVVELTIAPGSLATSGNAERGIVVDGARRSHLLDPRSGEPAPERGSVTVWASDATTADALSTALYVLGPEAAFEWHASPAARALGPTEFLFLEHGATGPVVRATTGWRGRLEPLVPGVTVTFNPARRP
jgi:thiamine biosynthesis lipoprotein